MDEIESKLKDLQRKNRLRYDYVIARADTKTIKDACEKIGVTQSWFYNFNQVDRDELEDLAAELHYETVMVARKIINDAAARAAWIKVEGLDSKREDTRQRVATEILDRVGVREPDKLDVGVADKTTQTVEEMLKRIYGDRYDRDRSNSRPE